MSDQNNPERPRPRRSPPYPTVDLGTALERALDLYKLEPRHPIPLGVAAAEWGFSEKSSSGPTMAAALKRYGLVRDVGSSEQRQLALTDEARELAFLDEERGSDRWNELMRAAALRPKINSQVLDHFGGKLPDDRLVLRHLLFDVGFADEATAGDYLKRLRATLTFAGLGSDPPHTERDPRQTTATSATDAEPAPQGGAVEGEGFVLQHQIPRPPEPSIYDNFRADQTLVQIPYSYGQWAALRASFPMTEKEWDAMITMLQAMKPGLVKPEDTGD